MMEMDEHEPDGEDAGVLGVCFTQTPTYSVSKPLNKVLQEQIEHEDEGQQLELGLSANPTSATPKTPIPCDSAPLFFDLLISDDDDTKKSQGEDKTVADPVSGVDTVMVHPDTTSSVVGNLSNTLGAPFVGSKFLTATSFDNKTQVHRSAPPLLTMTSLYLLRDDASSSAKNVPLLHTGPYDPGPLDSPPPAKVHLTLDFPNLQFLLDAILRLPPPLVISVFSINSEDDKIVAPAFLVAGNVVFFPLVNIGSFGGGTPDSNVYAKAKSLSNDHHVFVKMPLSNCLYMDKNTLKTKVSRELMSAANISRDHEAVVNSKPLSVTLVEAIHTIIENLPMIDLEKFSPTHLEQVEWMMNWSSFATNQTLVALKPAQELLLVEKIKIAAASVSILEFSGRLNLKKKKQKRWKELKEVETQ